MQTREKMIICAAGYLIAGALWFSVTSPALTDTATKTEDLNSKTKEHTDLKIKLSGLARLEKERQTLESEIDRLRGSVPKSPDIDILIIDLEKMCLDSGLDLVSIGEPDKEKLRAIEGADDAAPAPKVSSVISGGGNKPPEPPKGPAAAGAKKPQEVVETGLVKKFLQVNAQGSYAGCVELLKKLEAYERVIAITQVDVGFATEGKDVKAPDPNQLKISFLMTAYYLP